MKVITLSGRFRPTRSRYKLAEKFLRLGNDSTCTRTTRLAPSLPFGPSTVAVLALAVERSVIHPPRGSWFLAGSKTPKASQSLAARYLRPQGNDLTCSHTYVASEFTLCLLTARIGDFQQSLVRLVDLLEAFLSLGISVDVGVVLEGKPAKRPPDLLIRGSLAYAQNLIVDTHVTQATSSWLLTCSGTYARRTSAWGWMPFVPALSLRHSTYPRAPKTESPTSAVLAVPPRSGVKQPPSSRILRTARSMTDAAASSPMNRSIIAPDMIAAMGFAIP